MKSTIKFSLAVLALSLPLASIAQNRLQYIVKEIPQLCTNVNINVASNSTAFVGYASGAILAPAAIQLPGDVTEADIFFKAPINSNVIGASHFIVSSGPTADATLTSGLAGNSFLEGKFLIAAQALTCTNFVFAYHWNPNVQTNLGPLGPFLRIQQMSNGFASVPMQEPHLYIGYRTSQT